MIVLGNKGERYSPWFEDVFEVLKGERDAGRSDGLTNCIR